MRKFARMVGTILLTALTLFLTFAAATDETLSGWILYYTAALAYGSAVCFYYGFGEFDE